MADIPAGTGMGSSGAYLVALLAALYELKRERIPTRLLAEKACHIEMTLAGHAVGKHDHYLAAYGGITCLMIREDGQVETQALNISPTTLEEFRDRVLLFYMGITRSSRIILEAQRQDTQNGNDVVIESLHRTKELGYRIKEALEKGDLDTFGLLLDKHWQNKKRRSSEISHHKIDQWYELAKKCGGLGGKVMGAGGGGFFMFYCPKSCKAKMRSVLSKAGLREVAYDFDFDGAKILVNL
jgi:D-glycero-alpha-D-manno-heptose-7-phosphate kinase